MNFEMMKLPKEEAYKIRERFIDLFVDITKENYIKYIKPRKADDILVGDGFVDGYLYDCLKKDKCFFADEITVMDYLRQLGSRTLFVMYDIREAKHIYPDGIATLPPPYTKHFPSDTVLEIGADKLYEIIMHDNNCSFYEQYFGEDLYVIDPDCKWYIAFTHDFFTDDNGQDTDRIVYSNINQTVG